MKILLIAPRFFDAIHGEKRAMMSAYKSALSLSQHAEVVVVTAGPPPRYERISPTLSVYRLWDLFIPDPVNFGIAPGIVTQLPSIIRKERPDAFLVNKHMFSTSVAAPLLKAIGKRVVIQTDTFPGINWFPRNRFVKWVMQIYARTIGTWVLKSAHTVVLLHEGLIPIAEQFKLPYQVIHNGVDLQAFDAAEPATDITKQTGEIFVCYVGRLESVKGYDDLLVVAKNIAATHPNVKLFFVGSTEGKESVVAEYSSRQIIFTGHRRDVPALLKHMDIFVMPSYSEGLPNALMEAMAAGCAPIASDVGGMKILLEGGLGLMFTPGNKAALEQHLTTLITDPAQRERLGQQVRSRVEERFSLQTEILKLLHTLKQPENKR